MTPLHEKFIDKKIFLKAPKDAAKILGQGGSCITVQQIFHEINFEDHKNKPVT